MEVVELRNYGMSLNDCMKTVPRPMREEMRKTLDGWLEERIGEGNLQRVRQETIRQAARLAAVDLSAVRQRGLQDEEFIAALVARAAQFLALASVVGREKAFLLWMNAMASSPTSLTPRSMAAFMPTGTDFRRCADPFGAFRGYMAAQMEACARAGVLEFHIVEETPAGLAIGITYCAFAEVLRLLGAQESVRSSCSADELFFPGLGRQVGFVFRERSRTIGRGQSCCDMCFEKMQPGCDRRE